MMRSSNANTTIALATPVTGNTGHDNASDRSLLVQSMYAGSSASYINEQERERRNRPKPPPPVKPATLKNKIVCLRTSKLDISIADGNLPNTPSNTIDSSETAKVTCSSESITTESDPSFEAMRISDLCIEEVKRVENESSTLESTERSNSRNTVNNKRTSFINEEIKKPKMKPPPPPIQSLIRHSQSGRDSSKIETIRKKLNLEDISNTNEDITQNNAISDESAPSKAHRFERCLDSWHIPR